MRKELSDADMTLKAINDRLTVAKETLKENIPIYLYRSILFYTYCRSQKSVQDATVRHDKKLRTLSFSQGLLLGKKSLIQLDDNNPRAFLREIFSKRPKRPTPGKFNSFHFFSDIHHLLRKLDEEEIDLALLNHINDKPVLFADKKKQYANKVVRKVVS